MHVYNQEKQAYFDFFNRFMAFVLVSIYLYFIWLLLLQFVEATWPQINKYTHAHSQTKIAAHKKKYSIYLWWREWAKEGGGGGGVGFLGVFGGNKLIFQL